MTEPILVLDGICHQYDDKRVLNGLSFSLEKGEIGCLLGPSGCGKTTALRAIAGFEGVTAGTIRLNGRVVSEVGTVLAPEKRQVGVVFQDYALFPHLTVAQNVTFGLNRLSASERNVRVAELLEMVRLSDYSGKYPHELSGGEQQRVALARAMAPAPALILLDEPFSNLDTELRETLSLEVRAILKEAGMTAVLVTHDQHEAFAMADWIGVMHAGAIQQWDTAAGLYQQPANRFVAGFVGDGVFIEGRTTSSGLGVLSPLGELALASRVEPGRVVMILLRPESLTLDKNGVAGTVVARYFRGGATLYVVEITSGDRLKVWYAGSDKYREADLVGVRAVLDAAVIFSKGEGEERI